MNQHEYIFTIPADSPELTYKALNSYLAHRDRRKIGTTITVERSGDAFDIRLYHTLIAVISLGELLGTTEVRFTRHNDAHLATTEWLSKIVSDNKLGQRVWRIRRRASDPEGPVVARGHAGLLVIDGEREAPVEGETYVSRA